jgi:hypothetical protein
MDKAWSARLIVTQLATILDYLDRIIQGSFRQEHAERLEAANTILRDSILLQKSITLESLKPEIMGRINEMASDSDCMKLSLAMENIKPALKIEHSRIARITGPLLAGNRLNTEAIRSNVNVLFEALSSRYNSTIDPQKIESLQESSLFTLEALYEVIRTLIIQASSEINS